MKRTPRVFVRAAVRRHLLCLRSYPLAANKQLMSDGAYRVARYRNARARLQYQLALCGTRGPATRLPESKKDTAEKIYTENSDRKCSLRTHSLRADTPAWAPWPCASMNANKKQTNVSATTMSQLQCPDKNSETTCHMATMSRHMHDCCKLSV